MPAGDYNTSVNELILENPINDAGQRILPAEKEIVKDTPIDSLGERYRDIVDFDLTSEEVYDDLVADYPDAWDAYYSTGAAPAYSYENASSFKDALAFYLYITEDETYQYVASEDSTDFAPYIREEGSSPGTYENPDAYYNQDVYDRVTNSGADPLPRVEMDGDKVIGANNLTTDKPQYAEMYSTEQLAATEYETVKKGPKTAYDWGGAYATGKNTY